MKNAEISIQTIFFIMMSILMVAIIIFGIQKVMDTEELISEQERVEIKSKVVKAFEYCEDPLNAGSFKILEIKNSKINGICTIGKDILDSNSKYNKYVDLQVLYENDENIALIKSNLQYINTQIEIKDLQIVDSFSIDFNLDQTSCFFQDKKTGYTNLKVICN